MHVVLNKIGSVCEEKALNYLTELTNNYYLKFIT